MMSIKTVNALSHYTDWTIGHVHSGALGWVAMVSVGSLYMLIPRLYGQREMWSTRLIDVHFWTYYAIRLAGGLLVFAGMLLMVYNVVKTVQRGRPTPVPVPDAGADAHPALQPA